MANVFQHLEHLVAPSPESANDLRVLEDWSSWVGTKNSDAQDSEAIDREPWSSVLDVYRLDGQTDKTPFSRAPLPSKLLSLSNSDALLPSLHEILSSGRSNDVVSSEIAEMIGYENIELVEDILRDRGGCDRALVEIMAEPVSVMSRPHGANESLESAPGGLDQESARRRMEEKFHANASKPLWTGVAGPAPEVLPHVYTSSAVSQGNILSQYGSKYTLPMGTTRQDHEEYEEVIIPPAKPVPPKSTERLVSVSDLDFLCRSSFPGYKSLNRIQSIVYPTAYGSNENVLVCAPTGAGKTDVAMLTVLRVIDQHRDHREHNSPSIAASIKKEQFKIIYVAPMKALAAEITRKLGKRLKWLSITVKELTGDMQLTKKEIDETQIIVTTPEKWDVVTRKPSGEGELASKVKLLIIDEVHLLNDERGAVIETIVARTLRQVESTQSVIRIVGLSATLPNYVDVAEFLCVSKQTGLFYFDSSFRPVPLEQHFLGIRGKPGSALARKNMDKVTFEKVEEIVRRGYQVMVFVHARKETVKSALALKETALAEGSLDDFSCEEHPQWDFFRRSIGESRNKEMKQLFDFGFGIHHAGMLRSDRNMMERMFEARAIKVLVCTATLAWGVNLPAHAVVIKGTQIYDSGKGSFVDLSVLDVLQVFGRAGRPGLEDSGEGYICTTDDKLDHYLNAVTSQNPIESQFNAGMVDSLNAEVALGTVATINDAVTWLGYTYLFVRMRKNPFQYGLPRTEPADDPQLNNKRNQLATVAARKLADARMIAFDVAGGALTITDLGRIAAKYYIRNSSIEIFNKEFRPKMTEADVLAMLSKSTEFDQIQVRESEVKELEFLMNEIIPCAVKGGTDTSQGKVNILLQAYISQAYIEDFALVSDTAYAAQNGGRIARALLEIALSKKWAHVSATLMGICKAIEKRMWPFVHPLRQFALKPDVLHRLETHADEYSVSELAAMSGAELGELIRMNEQHGTALRTAAQQFPTARIDYALRPLGADVLKIVVRIQRAFTWGKIHGNAEPFWLWVEDADGSTILQMAHLSFKGNTDTLDTEFVISIPRHTKIPSVTIRFVSDRWMGAEEEVSVLLDSLVMPTSSNSHTSPLDLPYLRLAACRHAVLQTALSSRLHSFNAIQTQIFWSIVNTRLHGLVSGPTGSGKSLMGHISMWHTLLDGNAENWCLLVTPDRSVASETVWDLRQISAVLGVSVELVSANTVFSTVTSKTIRVVVAQQLLSALSRKVARRVLTGLRTVVLENLEQLDAQYELAVSVLRCLTQTVPVRYLGVAQSLMEPADLAAWLDADPFALHSFRPRDRDQALTQSIHPFNIPQSAALFKAMVKPAHAAIRAQRDDVAIVFVPSRAQCQSVARELITQATLETGMDRGYLPPQSDALDTILEDTLARTQESLRDFIGRGIGFFHDGINRADRARILDLYTEGIIRVLIVPRDASRAVPVRAGVVIVMGTQYIQYDPQGDKHRMAEYTLDDIIRMQGRAVRHGAGGHFHLFCNSESKDTYARFLDEGMPLESQLLETPDLARWYGQMRRDGAIKDRQAGVEALSWTFLAHRMGSNPAYYDLAGRARDENLSRLVDKLESEITSDETGSMQK